MKLEACGCCVPLIEEARSLGRASDLRLNMAKKIADGVRELSDPPQVAFLEMGGRLPRPRDARRLGLMQIVGSLVSPMLAPLKEPTERRRPCRWRARRQGVGGAFNPARDPLKTSD
jgi:hypothetical protein